MKTAALFVALLGSAANADEITALMMERAAQEGADMSLDESIQAKTSISGNVLRMAGSAGVAAAKSQQDQGHNFNSAEAKNAAKAAIISSLSGAGAVSAPQIAAINAGKYLKSPSILNQECLGLLTDQVYLAI